MHQFRVMKFKEAFEINHCLEFPQELDISYSIASTVVVRPCPRRHTTSHVFASFKSHAISTNFQNKVLRISIITILLWTFFW